MRLSSGSWSHSFGFAFVLLPLTAAFASVSGGCSSDGASDGETESASVSAVKHVDGGAPVKTQDAASDAGATHAIKNVFVILMENHNWSSIKGSSSAPYLNSLLTQAAHAEAYYDNPSAVHPSEPNYIWIESGDNLGITTDDDPPVNVQTTTDHFVTQLTKAGISWRAYVENITGTSCPIATNGLFAPKHTPMLFFSDIVGSPPSATSSNCISHVRPYTELAADLSSGKTARYNFITPNLCDDMHNATGCASNEVTDGDMWLSTAVPKILASSAYKEGGALFITWDESELGEHPIGMLVLSPFAKVGYQNGVKYFHSSLLRTVEEIFAVPLLRDAANRPDLSDLFTTFP